MPAKKIKVLFSDIGGVLLSNGWGHESRMKAAEQFGFDYEEMNHRHVFIFNVYEIGNISLDDYLDIAVFYKKRNFSRKVFKEFMYAQSVQLPETLDWLVKWKKKNSDTKVISINNEPRELNSYRIEKFQLHRFFDAFVSSGEVGMRKPDPGIFHLALSIAQATPEECIYIDDRAMLVQAAVKAGIPSHHHTGFSETKKLIEKIF